MSHAGFPFSLLLLEEGQIIRSPVALQSQGSGVCVCVCVLKLGSAGWWEYWHFGVRTPPKGL